MKKYMKKIIVGISALALLIIGNSAFAAGWNTYPSDCTPALTIANYSTGDGIRNGSNGCWTKTSVSANAGQVINVSVYYDNTNNVDAQNVRINLSQSPTGSMTSANSTYTFSGNLTSSNAGSLNLSQVTANLTSSQTLTFGQAKWFRKGSATGISLPNGQTGYEAFNGGGVNLGTLPDGDWGSVVFSFTIGTSPVNQTCQDSSANNYGGSLPCTYTTNVCTISSFTVNGATTSTTVQAGSPVTINWSTSGYSSVTVGGPNFSSTSTSGNQIIYPTTSGTYTLNGSGSNCGYQTRTVQVIVVPAFTPPVITTCAVTTIATNVTRTSATLNGSVSGFTNATGYFEYGPTIGMGLRTPTRTLTSGFFTETITGLNPNTPYFFRFIGNCGNGFSNGTVQTFSTTGTVTTTTTTVRPPTIVQGTTVIGTSSPIMLTIENRYEFIGIGDVIDYTVTYRNIGNTLLTRPVLQVVVPKGIVITNASRGTYSLETNTLTVQLEDLYPGAGGVVYLQGRVDSLALGNAQIVSTAILVYTSPSGAQENAIAYVLNGPKDGSVNNLGAAAFFAGIFPSTLLGWLLLLLIILLIVLATRRYYNKRTVVVPPSSYNSMNH
jgi:hypothetical protein